MVDLPGHYRWSSFCHNIGEHQINFIQFHPIYNALGYSKNNRYHVYQKLFSNQLSSEEIKHIREFWQTKNSLVNDVFCEKIE